MKDYESKFNILEVYLDFLSEAKKSSVSKTSKKTKIKRATGTMATAEARKKKDPMYTKMIFHRDKWKHYKEKVQKKYSARVKSRARK